MRELAAQFLALAEKQGSTVPLIIGHRLVGASLVLTGDIAESRAHYDRRSQSTIPPDIARWRHGLGRTSGLQPYRIGRSRFRCWAITNRQSPTRNTR